MDYFAQTSALAAQHFQDFMLCVRSRTVIMFYLQSWAAKIISLKLKSRLTVSFSSFRVFGWFDLILPYVSSKPPLIVDLIVALLT